MTLEFSTAEQHRWFYSSASVTATEQSRWEGGGGVTSARRDSRRLCIAQGSWPAWRRCSLRIKGQLRSQGLEKPRKPLLDNHQLCSMHNLPSPGASAGWRAAWSRDFRGSRSAPPHVGARPARECPIERCDIPSLRVAFSHQGCFREPRAGFNLLCVFWAPWAKGRWWFSEQDPWSDESLLVFRSCFQ